MKIFLKAIFTIFLIVSGASISAYYFWYKPKFKIVNHSAFSSPKISFEEIERLKQQSYAIKKFTLHKHYNSKICFLIDMKISSGKKRFFVYDLQNDSVLLSGLVAHGSCDNGFQVSATFSNKNKSGCSCLGKFKIGNSYNGRFGLSYKLYGLDSTNSNTYERSIVLHSYREVPEEETYPLPICNSRGCAMVSTGFLQMLKLYLDRSNKPVLLEIFN